MPLKVTWQRRMLYLAALHLRTLAGPRNPEAAERIAQIMGIDVRSLDKKLSRFRKQLMPSDLKQLEMLRTQPRLRPEQMETLFKVLTDMATLTEPAAQRRFNRALDRRPVNEIADAWNHLNRRSGKPLQRAEYVDTPEGRKVRVWYESRNICPRKR
jgi:hypothetical protein